MIRGWCPTVHAPMPSGDGLLARVKPFGGQLPAAAIAALANAAASYGNGTIELTGRGNIQVRGIHDPAAFARAMVTAGLADADPEREARRNVTTVPPTDDALVLDAEAVLADTPGLPPKFNVIVHGGEIHVGSDIVRSAGELRRLLAHTSPPLSQWEMPSHPGQARGEGPSDAVGLHLLYLPFGQTDAATLATLTADVRTTPWRAFLSPVRARGFLDQPSPIVACPGKPACASGTVPARTDAATLQAAGFKHIHVSGCAKGCAYPTAARTLVGRNGRYDLVRSGRASDRPDLSGLTLAEVMVAL